MKKLISKVVAGIVIAIMVVAVTVYADTKIIGSKTAVTSGALDSIGTEGYTNVGIIIHMTKTDSLYFKVEGAQRMGQGNYKWFNLDSDNATTTFDATSGDSTVAVIYNGWMPYVRFNVTRFDSVAAGSATAATLTWFWLLWKE